jgi:hypothetical protein
MAVTPIIEILNLKKILIFFYEFRGIRLSKWKRIDCRKSDFVSVIFISPPIFSRLDSAVRGGWIACPPQATSLNDNYFFNWMLNVGDLFDFNVAESVSFCAFVHMLAGHLNVCVVLPVCESVRADKHCLLWRRIWRHVHGIYSVLCLNNIHCISFRYTLSAVLTRFVRIPVNLHVFTYASIKPCKPAETILGLVQRTVAGNDLIG